MDEFNPTDHTVDEVNAYLADADPDEQTRVLEAEANGKARVGILGDASATEAEDQGDMKPEQFQEAAKAVVEPETEAGKRGYFGHVPSRDGDEPVDLTLAAVTKEA